MVAQAEQKVLLAILSGCPWTSPLGVIQAPWSVSHNRMLRREETTSIFTYGGKDSRRSQLLHLINCGVVSPLELWFIWRWGLQVVVILSIFRRCQPTSDEHSPDSRRTACYSGWLHWKFGFSRAWQLPVPAKRPDRRFSPRRATGWAGKFGVDPRSCVPIKAFGRDETALGRALSEEGLDQGGSSDVARIVPWKLPEETFGLVFRSLNRERMKVGCFALELWDEHQCQDVYILD